MKLQTFSVWKTGKKKFAEYKRPPLCELRKRHDPSVLFLIVNTWKMRTVDLPLDDSLGVVAHGIQIVKSRRVACWTWPWKYSANHSKVVRAAWNKIQSSWERWGATFSVEAMILFPSYLKKAWGDMIWRSLYSTHLTMDQHRWRALW